MTFFPAVIIKGRPSCHGLQSQSWWHLARVELSTYKLRHVSIPHWHGTPMTSRNMTLHCWRHDWFSSSQLVAEFLYQTGLIISQTHLLHFCSQRSEGTIRLIFHLSSARCARLVSSGAPPSRKLQRFRPRRNHHEVRSANL